MGKVIDGKGTTLTWSSNSTFTLDKVELTPFELDAGDGMDLSHLGSVKYAMTAPASLIKVGPIEFSAHWDQAKHVSAPIGVNDKITITYPDGSKHEVYGFLQKLTPDAVKLSEVTNCKGTIVVSNIHSSTGAETGPVATAATTTTTTTTVG